MLWTSSEGIAATLGTQSGMPEHGFCDAGRAWFSLCILNRPIFAGRIRAAQRAKAVEALFINGFFIMSMQDSIKH